jgi:hypothetical protein
VFLVGFLVVLIAGDPGLINRERRWLRSTTEVMIVLITLANAVSAVRLVADILTRGSSTPPVGSYDPGEPCARRAGADPGIARLEPPERALVRPALRRPARRKALHLKIGWSRIITRQHLEAFLDCPIWE